MSLDRFQAKVSCALPQSLSFRSCFRQLRNRIVSRFLGFHQCFAAVDVWCSVSVTVGCESLNFMLCLDLGFAEGKGKYR